MIEASMSNWQFFLIITLYADDEVDVLKASDGDTSRSCRESEKLLSLLIVEFIIYYLPEPVDKLVIGVQRLDVFRDSHELFKVEYL